MSHTHLFLLPFALCAALSVSPALGQSNPKPFTVPELTGWTGAQGTFTPSGRVVCTGGSRSVSAVAKAFVDDYRALTGRTLTLAKGKPQTGDFVLSLRPQKGAAPERYTLDIGQTARLTAATTQGLIWATRTVLQLSEQGIGGCLPKGQAIDEPQYKMRGLMLDCGRKYIPMSYLRSLVKVMAYYKMNTLHVHLNDNGFRQYFGGDWMKTQSAFRLESDFFPGLTAKDGHYTKAEFRSFQRWADSLGVEIIPEFDVPAHSLAFTQYRPSLGSKEYGMDHLDLFNPETEQFVDSLFLEYLGGKDPVFCGRRFHIGTDEYSNATPELVAKFRGFTDHCIRQAQKYGKQAMLWGALSFADGPTPVQNENVLMDVWSNGFARPKEMKKQGYKLVCIPDGLVYIVPAAGYYYDYLNCAYLYDHWTPANFGGGDNQLEECDPAIEGGMFAVWNDHCGNGITVKDIHHRVMPALQTISQKSWTASLTSRPWSEFEAKSKELAEAPGVNELGRALADGRPVAPGRYVKTRLGEIKPGAQTQLDEIGYDYTVSFTVQAAEEEKGAVLLENEHAKFYLSDPRSGCLGFERDGYLNTFSYRLPVGKTVRVTVQGNNKMTRLLVDGKQRQELGVRTVYVVRPENRLDQQVGASRVFTPEVYSPGDRMNYHSTLVFPLRRGGNFKSQVYDFSVSNRIE